MLDDNRRMKLWALVFWIAVGCTKPNPRSCLDGTCTDPAFPFCDVDGSLEGTPGTCITVSCSPMEFAGCRGDEAIVCNSVGSNFDLVRCPFGCSEASAGCNGCDDNIQCDEATPVCDAGACRVCGLDAECASKVCELESGRCLDESNIVYASANGLTSGLCTQQAPCSLAHAVTTAAGDATRSTIRMDAGRYTGPLTLAAGVVSLVGVGATLRNDVSTPPLTPTVRVTNDATIRIRALTIDQTAGGFECTGNVLANMTLEEVQVVADNANNVNEQFTRCALTVRRSSLSTTGPSLFDDAVLDIDQSRFVSLDTSLNRGITGSGRRMKFTITNSIFDQIHVAQVPPPGDTLSEFYFAFNTVVSPRDFSVNCRNQNNTNWVAIVENNIIAGAPSNVLLGSDCTANHNILFPQAMSVPVTNLIADPQLTDTTAGDFRPRATSPAIDAAMPSVGLSTNHDFAGTPRPQGPQPDIGAFEIVP